MVAKLESVVRRLKTALLVMETKRHTPQPMVTLSSHTRSLLASATARAQTVRAEKAARENHKGKKKNILTAHESGKKHHQAV